VQQSWHVVDASDQVLGRLSTRVAMILRGKHRALFTPHADLGDHVIVVNAERVSLKSRTADEVLAGAHPERVIEHAVRGMLPKNSLGRKLFRKLKVYAGPEHPHAAQKPQEISLG
jgi:large subunit ribosomal protein L13